PTMKPFGFSVGAKAAVSHNAANVGAAPRATSSRTMSASIESQPRKTTRSDDATTETVPGSDDARPHEAGWPHGSSGRKSRGAERRVARHRQGARARARGGGRGGGVRGTVVARTSRRAAGDRRGHRRGDRG